MELAGEIGLLLDTEFHADGKTFTLRHLFSHSFQWFHPDNELEFTACAYALYLPPGSIWQNRFGEEYNFDRLVEGLLARKVEESSCYGTHIPYALAILLAADQQEPMLSPTARESIETRLRAYSKELVESQSGAGSWDRHWTKEETARDAIEDKEQEWIRSTGHHLEWMALVNPELRPPEKNIKMAIKFVLDFLTHLNPGHHSQSLFFNPCSHAARALVLFSGHQFAGELMEEVWSKRNSQRQGPASSTKQADPRR